MPEILPDLSEVTSNVIDPGTYEAMVKSVTPGTSKTGNPKIDVEFEVNFNGAVVPRTQSIPISGKGAFKFAQLLRATNFGPVADKLAKGERAPFITEDLEGQRLTVVIEADEYQGEARDKIVKFIKAG